MEGLKTPSLQNKLKVVQSKNAGLINHIPNSIDTTNRVWHPCTSLSQLAQAVMTSDASAHHTLMGGRLHVYKRPGSRYWQCSTYLAGKNHRKTLHEEGIAQAKDLAEDWFLGLKLKNKAGELQGGKTFADAAKQFKIEYGALTQGQRNHQYVDGHWRRLKLHILPFLGPLPLAAATAGKVQEYRVHRMTRPEGAEKWKPPAHSTLHQEIVVIRQVLKTAQRHGWLSNLPDLSPPWKSSTKVGHRAWFSKLEYRQLYLATRDRAKHPRKEQWRRRCEDFHDYVLFLGNTGLRPDEAHLLEYRDVNVVRDHDSQEVILVIDVRGKRGTGYCKSTRQAVTPFLRLRKRANPKPTDRLFPTSFSALLNAVLQDLDLKFDREGKRRTAYSLRHSYICFRLSEGADVYQIAKNCRTSVEMIQKYYAVHIKDTLNAAAINVRRERPAHAKRSPKWRRSPKSPGRHDKPLDGKA